MIEVKLGGFGKERPAVSPEEQESMEPLIEVNLGGFGKGSPAVSLLIVAQREAWPVYLRPSLAHTKSDLYTSQYLIRRACVPDTRIDEFRHLPFIPMMPNLKSSCTSVKTTLNNP
ncbi:hypothetical protein NL676_007860 [Syzygium grande]|nr:hypothetical protein NL676_007860 [Syzygium grande]